MQKEIVIVLLLTKALHTECSSNIISKVLNNSPALHSWDYRGCFLQHRVQPFVDVSLSWCSGECQETCLHMRKWEIKLNVILFPVTHCWLSYRIYQTFINHSLFAIAWFSNHTTRQVLPRTILSFIWKEVGSEALRSVLKVRQLTAKREKQHSKQILSDVKLFILKYFNLKVSRSVGYPAFLWFKFWSSSF